MAYVVADRVRETSSSTGTGALALSGPVSGFRSVASVMAVGDTADFAIALGPSWEVATCTLQAGNILARTTVLASSNGGSPVNFGTGLKDVALVLPAVRAALLTGLTNGTAQPFADTYRVAVNTALPTAPASGLLVRGRTFGSFDMLAALDALGGVSYLNPPLALISQGRVLSTAPVAAVDITLPTDFEGYELAVHHYLPATNGEDLRVRFSLDAGATFVVGTNYSFAQSYDDNTPAGGSIGETAVSYFAPVRNQQNAAGMNGAYMRMQVWQAPTGGSRVSVMWEALSLTGANLRRTYRGGGYMNGATSRATTLRLVSSSGNITQLVYRLSGMQRLLGV
jgi:hypothetical protein